MILEIMRKQKRLFAWVFLPVLVIGLVAYLIPGVGGVWGQGISISSLARVGDAEISSQELKNAIHRFLRSSQVPYDRKFLKMMKIEEEILNQLISREIIVHHGQRLGIDATSHEIQKKILTIPAFLEDENFLLNRYKLILSQNGLTVDEFEEGVRFEIVQEKLRHLVTEHLGVSDEEAMAEYRNKHEKAKISYVSFDPGAYAKSVKIQQKESKDYYDQNKEKYRMPERRKVHYLLADKNTLKSQNQPSESAMKAYYRKNQSDFRLQEEVRASHILFKNTQKSGPEFEQIKRKAETVLNAAKKGKDFAQLAKQYSEDGSASNGGDLGFFGRGRMVPEFENVAFALQVDEISNLVTSQFGFHIIKVLEKQVARTQDFEEVKGFISSSLSSEKAESNARDLANKAYRRAKENLSFEDIAKELEIRSEVTPFISPGNPFPSIGSAPELSTKMFSMSIGEISAPVEVPNGYLLVKLLEVKSSSVPTFSEVEERVKESMTNEKTEEIAKSKANDLVKRVRTGQKFAFVARRFGLKVKLSETFSRNGTLKDLGTSTPLDEFTFSAEINNISDPIRIGSNLIVVQLKEKIPVDQGQFVKAKQGIMDRLLIERKDVVFKAFLDRAKSKMEKSGEISINQSSLINLVDQF